MLEALPADGALSALSRRGHPAIKLRAPATGHRKAVLCKTVALVDSDGGAYLGDHAKLGMLVPHHLLLEARMELDLVDGGHRVGPVDVAPDHHVEAEGPA